MPPLPGHTSHGRAIQRRLVRELDLLADRAVQVAGLEKSGPAQKAGLEPGDLILSVNGRVTTSVDDLHQILARLPVDKSVALSILRDDLVLDLHVQPALGR